MITKEQAITLLERYLNDRYGSWSGITLPKHDEVVKSDAAPKSLGDYLLRYLLCVAYDLQEK